ncbi:MAG TPA: nucleotidyltransferase domain-containing protein, partial [Anaerolineales bacterium]|nr:nucleotidyltransferase domain-containing protein [Anaerolineales bacterium]
MNFSQEQIIQTTITNILSFDEVVARLAVSEAVDGLALFGSRSTDDASPISDYDLLILVKDLPVRIFQMLTHIEQRMADIVFVETEIADRVLVSAARVSANSFEGMFLLKMRKAQIIHDASGRLGRVQQLIKQEAQLLDRLLPSPEPALYAVWFWQNHGLYHMKR